MPENLNNNYLDEDAELIVKFTEGDSTAFGKLVLRHKDKVRNLIYLTLGDTDQIDDISQDVFISIFNNLGEFKFESKFTTWLYRITVNKCRDFLRKKRVRNIMVPIADGERNLGASYQSEGHEFKILLRNAIKKLPEKLQEPLIMRDIQGLSYSEISEALNCDLGTIKSRIFRARETLKILLEPYQKEYLG